MEKEQLIELTKQLYRLTLLFPKKEPLRYRMREVGLNVLADLISALFENSNANIQRHSGNLMETGFLRSLEELEVLDGFFDLAISQDWVKKELILAIREEYDRLREELKNISLEMPIIVDPSKAISFATEEDFDESLRSQLSSPSLERRSKIIEYLKENGRVQVWQIKEILPDVSKRTLRRDFEQMLSQGIVQRVGERNETFYQIRFDKG